MPKYVYKGPTTGLTFKDGTERMLFDGAQVDLPDCEAVTTLQAQGWLTPVQAEPATQAKTVPAPPAQTDKKGA